MNLDQFIAKYSGQSVLYNTRDASLRGQCVQLVCFYVSEVCGKPVIWADAAKWWSSGLFPEHYERITNDIHSIPKRGDIIVWASSLPNSGGAGHIAICVEPRPGTGTFVSFDSNWGGKNAKLVTHNYTNVVGWLRPRVPAPQVTQPQGGGIEMITNADQANKIYKMLRPNGGASQGEIDSTAGRRSFAEFIESAQAEINVRDANFRSQAEQLTNMSNTINNQNQTITTLTQKLNDSELSGAEKQKALDKALSKLADQNSQIANSHDQIVELQKKVVVTDKPFSVPKPNLLIRILAKFVKSKTS